MFYNIIKFTLSNGKWINQLKNNPITEWGKERYLKCLFIEYIVANLLSSALVGSINCNNGTHIIANYHPQFPTILHCYMDKYNFC